MESAFSFTVGKKPLLLIIITFIVSVKNFLFLPKTYFNKATQNNCDHWMFYVWAKFMTSTDATMW